MPKTLMFGVYENAAKDFETEFLLVQATEEANVAHKEFVGV